MLVFAVLDEIWHKIYDEPCKMHYFVWLVIFLTLLIITITKFNFLKDW